MGEEEGGERGEGGGMYSAGGELIEDGEVGGLCEDEGGGQDGDEGETGELHLWRCSPDSEDSRTSGNVQDPERSIDGERQVLQQVRFYSVRYSYR